MENNNKISNSCNKYGPQYLDSILGEFGIKNLAMSIKKSIKNKMLEDTVSFHEREHYFQTISSTVGYYLSEIIQSDELWIIKDLIKKLKEINVIDVYLPFLEWSYEEKRPKVKEILIKFVKEYYDKRVLELAILGSQKINRIDERYLLNERIDIDKYYLKYSNRNFGLLSLMEGLAQLKTLFYCLTYRNENEPNYKKTVSIQWEILQEYPYKHFIDYTSYILKKNLWNINILKKYYKLLILAGDIAIQIPLQDTNDIYELLPGYRYEKIVDELSKIKIINKKDIYGIIENILLKAGWFSEKENINHLFSDYDLNIISAKDSFIKRSFRMALFHRIEEPTIFAYSVEHIKELRYKYILPQEYYYDANNEREYIDQYSLPFQIRPSLAKQLLYSKKLICPLVKKGDSSKIKKDKKYVEIDKCNGDPINKNQCTFNLLVHNLGLAYKGKDIVIIQ